MEGAATNSNNPKTQKKQQKWFFSLIFSLLITSLLIVFSLFASSITNPFHKTTANTLKTPKFVESNLRTSPTSKNLIPKIAYLVSGSKGDGESIKRTLKALYHPLNQYAVHLDLEASPRERMELIEFVRHEGVFKKFGNVRVVSKSNLVTYRGPTMVSNTLHAAAILLKECGDWDWFVNLSASDYPLVTQDDLLHTLSTIPRDLNFLEHTSDIGWKEWGRAKPVIIDPGLYSLQKSDVFWVPEPRTTPTAFKLFTGSAWMMLSRSFMEYCLWGWDNLPRTVLMYYANFLSSPEGYFHTVICNAEEFRNTTVNHDLHYISWDNPPQQHPHFLTVDDYQQMVDSNAPFARKFGRNEAVLDKIDSELLARDPDGFVPGGWLEMTDEKKLIIDDGLMNSSVAIKPGPGVLRLKRFINGLIRKVDFRAKQCI